MQDKVTTRQNTGPVPQGMYVPAVRYGGTIYVSGMTPRLNGTLIKEGHVRPGHTPEMYADAVRLAAENALLAAQSKLLDGEEIAAILSMTVYVACTMDFQEHSKIADIASAFFHELFGTTGIASRAALGVNSLPGGAPVEIQIVVQVA